MLLIGPRPLTLLLLVLAGTLGGCGDPGPDTGPRETADARLPLRLVADTADEGTPPILEEDLTDLGSWWVLDLGTDELTTAADHPLVASRKDGVTLTAKGHVLVRFVELPPQVTISMTARIGGEDPAEVCGNLHLVGLESLEDGRTVDDIVRADVVATRGEDTMPLGQWLRVKLHKSLQSPKAEWISMPDADGFARARVRQGGIDRPYARAIVLAPSAPRTRFTDVRIDPRPELQKAHKRNASGITADLGEKGSEPRMLAATISSESRMSLVVPPGGRHTFAVDVPQGARVLSFGACIRPETATGARSRWTVSIATADEERELGRGSVSKSSSSPVLFEDEALRLPATLHGGGTARLTFTADGDDAVVFGQPMIRGPRGDDRPNLLFVSLDTLRADSLGYHGYERPTSPYLDALAERSAVFLNCMGVGPYTLPTHTTLFTGLHPLRHGVIDGGADRMDGHKLPYLPRLLAEEGYVTAAFTGGGFLSPDYGFAVGFDRLRWIDPVINRESEMAQRRYERNIPEHIEELERLADIDTVADWIDEHEDERWFALIHTFAIHDYQPPEEDLELFDTLPDSEWGRELDELQQYLGPRPDGWRGNPPDDEQITHLRNLYDGTIRFTDRKLGLFLERLEERGHLDNTVVVITSDHGEEFYEHAGLRHSVTVYEEMLHVPLLVLAPCATGGRRMREPVGQADVTPTILELLDLPVTEGLDGRSVAELVCGGALQETLPPLLLGHVQTLNAHRISLRTGRLKLIRSESSPDAGIKFPAAEPWELYDLAEDPGETRNLVSSLPQDFEKLRQSLEAFESQLRAGAVDSGDVELSPEQLQALQELGYF